MISGKEAILGIGSAAAIGVGGVSAADSIIDAQIYDRFAAQSRASDRTPILFESKSRLEYAKEALIYSRTVIENGNTSTVVITFPDGITAGRNLDLAAQGLEGEPKIVEKILIVADDIPQIQEITQYQGRPVDGSTFREERDRIEQIREELESLSAQDQVAIKTWDDKTDEAIGRLIGSLFFVGLGGLYPVAYLAGKNYDRSHRRK